MTLSTTPTSDDSTRGRLQGILVVGLLLAPYGWLVRWAFVVAMPLAWLGGERSWMPLLAATTLAAALWGFLSFTLGRRVREGKPVAILVGLAVGWIAIPVGALWLHTIFGTPITSAEQCYGWTSVIPEVCRGRDSSFLQGRHRYARLEGTAGSGVCEKLRGHDQEEVKGPCDPDDAHDWPGVACARYGIRKDWSCYACSKIKGSGDTDYVVYGFDRQCVRGVALVSTNVRPEQIPAMIGH